MQFVFLFFNVHFLSWPSGSTCSLAGKGVSSAVAGHRRQKLQNQIEKTEDIAHDSNNCWVWQSILRHSHHHNVIRPFHTYWVLWLPKEDKQTEWPARSNLEHIESSSQCANAMQYRAFRLAFISFLFLFYQAFLYFHNFSYMFYLFLSCFFQSFSELGWLHNEVLRWRSNFGPWESGAGREAGIPHLWETRIGVQSWTQFHPVEPCWTHSSLDFLQCYILLIGQEASVVVSLSFLLFLLFQIASSLPPSLMSLLLFPLIWKSLDSEHLWPAPTELTKTIPDLHSFV